MNKSTDEKIFLDEYSVEPDDVKDDYAAEMTLTPTVGDEQKKISDAPKPKTFHSKRAVPVDDADTDAAPKRKRRFSHAETGGMVISTVMLLYSLTAGDKPLFFVSAALLTFLLRPLIGALFGKHSHAVRNALHTFSIVLFIGAMLMLFLSG